ncbi:alpha/beta fold hydrolase [Colwellia ponticola]|uniref:Alpha/beta hydrolase n=1 Tax=Colwellia ponticola TaxID=2304625 RepID=A0A8H2PN61_9GAMM|nr:alpha/beta hydrolase [Colwellia ponticola]TMM47461.1 alpha/beta hydrolase [Colwellia ponticola]
MSKDIIVFSHANGFPAGSYKTLFSYLPDSMQVVALEKYGHNANKPVNHNWQAQVEELITFVEEQQLDGKKAICVGHSFGGVISFLACCQRPDLFKGLIMLDPPVLSGINALTIRLLKKTKWIDKFSPAGLAKKRRSHWPLGADVGLGFSKRKLFRNFDSRCLADYITHGICQRNNQLELVFDAQIEANIFRNIPSNLARYKNKLTIPATLVHAESTDTFPHEIFQRFTKLNKHIKLTTMPGGHMFPLESPEQTAKLISDIISDFPDS